MLSVADQKEDKSRKYLIGHLKLECPANSGQKNSYLFNRYELNFLACVQDFLDEPLSPKPSVGECGEDYLDYLSLPLSYWNLSQKSTCLQGLKAHLSQI